MMKRSPGLKDGGAGSRMQNDTSSRVLLGVVTLRVWRAAVHVGLKRSDTTERLTLHFLAERTEKGDAGGLGKGSELWEASELKPLWRRRGGLRRGGGTVCQLSQCLRDRAQEAVEGCLEEKANC